MTIGVIYKMTNIKTGKSYIGQTLNLRRRIRTHQSAIAKSCRKLHDAINEYGFKSFKFRIIRKCKTKKEMDYFEELYIAKYKTVESGYNILPGSQYGKKPQDVRDRISKSLTGVPTGRRPTKKSIDRLLKYNKSCIGKKLTEEHKKKCSDALRGRKFSDEHRKKISIALTGRKFSSTHIENIRKAKKGLSLKRGNKWTVSMSQQK